MGAYVACKRNKIINKTEEKNEAFSELMYLIFSLSHDSYYIKSINASRTAVPCISDVKLTNIFCVHTLNKILKTLWCN